MKKLLLLLYFPAFTTADSATASVAADTLATPDIAHMAQVAEGMYKTMITFAN
ncbi:hypothetical protein [Pontibacter diazotrophicus]|uniref:hypothetical protein n=1 Tax=Pontibacter diazotrophicus TaxID=1400979 RepID=UPI0015F17475|nr:hypothetical protein [Pontibacter diazotrophicus]